jgi:hypothetical protein
VLAEDKQQRARIFLRGVLTAVGFGALYWVRAARALRRGRLI